MAEHIVIRVAHQPHALRRLPVAGCRVWPSLPGRRLSTISAVISADSSRPPTNALEEAGQIGGRAHHVAGRVGAAHREQRGGVLQLVGVDQAFRPSATFRRLRRPGAVPAPAAAAGGDSSRAPDARADMPRRRRRNCPSGQAGPARAHGFALRASCRSAVRSACRPARSRCCCRCRWRRARPAVRRCRRVPRFRPGSRRGRDPSA